MKFIILANDLLNAHFFARLKTLCYPLISFKLPRNGEAMSKLIDLTGLRYGKLVVTGPADVKGWWATKCDCGSTKVIRGASLRSGNTKSCGCLVRRNPGRPARPKYQAHIPAGSFIAETAEFITPIRNALARKGVIINSKGELRYDGRVEKYKHPYEALGQALIKCLYVPPSLESNKS